MAVVGYLKATYEDGFELVENERDESSYVAGANVFSDILHMRPCDEHGRLIEFALVTPENTHTVDWTKVPADARPVRLKYMQMHQTGENAPSEAYAVAIAFGYEVDHNGVTRQEVIEIR